MPLTTLTKVSSKQLDTATLSMSRLSDVDLSTPPTTGQTVIWNGTKFIAGASFSASDFNTAFSAKTTSNLSEGTNLYFTNTRARNAVSATGSISYNSSTGVFSFTQGDTDTITEGISNLYFTTARARNAVSAVGSISYNSSTGVFSFTQGNTDTVSEGTTNLYFTTARARSALSAGTGISYNSTTGVVASSITQYTDALARAAISAGSNITYSSSTGVISLSSANVTGALGFTPYNSTNPSGYTSNTGTVTSVGGTGTVSGLTLSGSVTTSGNLTLGGTLSLTSSNVTTALGFTPYNATNPSGYTNNTGTVTSVGGTGTVSGLTLTGSVTTTGNLTLGGTLSLTSSQVTTALGFTPSSTITVKDEGTSLTTSAASIDFVGAGVTATTTGNNVTVTIPGGGGGGGSGTTTNALSIGPGLANDGDLLWTLTAPDSWGEAFGTAVATNGTYTAVSYPYSSGGYGGVAIYHNASGKKYYNIAGQSINANMRTLGWSPSSIAMYGTYIAIGGLKTTSTDPGSVYLFNMANWAAYSGTTINIASGDVIATVTDTQNTNYAQFGRSVALSSSYMVVGAPYDTSGGYTSGGRVYVYSLTGTLRHIIEDPNASAAGPSAAAQGTQAYDFFGMSVAITGHYLVVGAPGEATGSYSGSGKAYIFNTGTLPTYSGSPVTVTADTTKNLWLALVLNNPDPMYDYAGMGWSVATNGIYVAVGANNAGGKIRYNNPNGWGDRVPSVGSVFVFNADTGAFQYRLESPNPITNQGQSFGTSIAMSGNEVLVGEPLDAIQGPGNAYLYSTVDGKLKKVINDYNAIGLGNGDNFGSSVAMSGNYAVIGAPNEKLAGDTGLNGGAAYILNTSRTFDGSSAMTVTLAPTPVVPGVYGSASGSYFEIPRITVDQWGRVNNIFAQSTYISPGLSSAFANVWVSGTPLIPASGPDYINFVAGSNVTITGDAASRTITISSSGGGGSGGGGSSAASQFKFAAGPSAVSFSSSMASITGPAGSGRVFGTFFAPGYSVLSVMSPTGPVNQLPGPYAGSPWVTSASGSNIQFDVQTDNWGGNPTMLYAQLFVLNSATNPDFIPCYHCGANGYSPDGSFPLPNGPQQQYGIFLSNPNYVYGVIYGMMGPLDMTNFQPAPGVVFYYDSAAQVGLFNAPGNLVSMNGSLGTLPGFNGSFGISAYYFGS